MKYNRAEEGIRERLLVAGLKELEEHGFNDFSLRRVALLCNISCAAPYKHFKNKEELLSALMDYTSTRWNMLRDQIIEVYQDSSPRVRLKELCVAYVRFLLATPSFLTILTLHSTKNESVKGLRSRISAPIIEIINCIVGESKAEEEVRTKMLYALRAYMYGTVCMIRNDEVANVDTAIDICRDLLDRIIGDAEASARRCRETEDTEI